MASTSVVFDLIAKDRASDAFQRVSRSAGHTSGTMSRLGAVAGRVAKAGLFAAGVGAVAAGKGLYEMAQSAAEDEAAQVRLATSLKNAAGATRDQIASTEAWIKAQGKALGVTDDDLRPALARLAEATGDVGQAQRLASLAMDVSAGTGRSLKSVSEALMKAQNGQISGLSRLGIETKNAAGETLTFEQATKRMADTFKGQAERNANTLSGKMARLKVTMSEVGEEIGAKVIPVAEDLADWFLADGLPAIEKFANEIGDHLGPALEDAAQWFRENKDELQDLGSTISGNVIPPLKSLVELVADAVSWFADLPGPVKEIGVQAGIAALVFPRLAAGVTTTTAAVTTSIARLQQFRAELTYTETRGAAVTGVMSKMGGAMRMAAGVGGMVALTQGAQETNKTLGLLETTAGGALLGFSVGGPWGAAIGAGAGALMGLATQTDETGNSMEGAKPKIQSMVDSLDDLTGATTRATREMALQNLQLKDGEGRYGDVISIANDYGISQRTLVDAALGNASAIRRVNKAIREQGYGQHDLIDSTGKVIGSYNGLDISAKYLRRSLGLISGELRDNQRDARKAARSAQELTGKLKSVPRNVRTKVLADGVPVSIKGLARLASRYDLMPKHIRTLITAAELPFTVKQVQKFQSELDKTDKKRPKPKVDADIDAAWRNFFRVDQEMKDLDRKEAKPKVDANIDGWLAGLRQVNSTANALGPYYVDIYERYHPDPRNNGGGGNGGGNGDPASAPGNSRTNDETSGVLLTLARAGKQQGNKAAKVFHDIGKDVISAFLKGVDGSQKKAEQVFDKIMKAIAEALKKGKIGEKAAAEMREAARRMMAEADNMRQQLEAKMQFGKQIASGLRGELDLATLAEGGLSGIIGGTAGLASRLRAFAGQLKELGAAGIPGALIREVAALGSEQGGTVAAALLSGTKAERRALSKAFRDVNRFADQAGNAASNAVYGTNKDIRREHNVTNVNVRIDAGVAGDPDAIARKLEQIFVKYQRNQGRRLRFQGAA